MVVGLILLMQVVATFWNVAGDRWQNQVAAPAVLLTNAGVLLVAAILFSTDPWLAAFLAYVVARAIVAPTVYALSTIEYTLAGSLLLMSVRALSGVWKQRLQSILVATVVFQLLYASIQIVGYDPLWFGLQHPPGLTVMGTVRSVWGFAAYLAILTPMGPWLLAVPVVIVLLWSKAVAGILALVIGLLIGLKSRALAMLLGASGLVVIVSILAQRPMVRIMWRVDAWRYAFVGVDKNWLFGSGFGSWYETVPFMQQANNITTSLADYAHNELLQLFYDGGVIAIIVLAGWVWHNRHVFRNGSVVAFATMCLVYFPMHFPFTAIAGICAIGLAGDRRQR